MYEVFYILKDFTFSSLSFVFFRIFDKGNQSLSFHAAMSLIRRGTEFYIDSSLVHKDFEGKDPEFIEDEHLNKCPVRFRHDPRLIARSYFSLSEDMNDSFLQRIRKDMPLLYIEPINGWPFDPSIMKRRLEMVKCSITHVKV